MILSCVFCLLAGMFLGTRYTAFILLPASFATAALAFVFWLQQATSLGGALALFALLSATLQVGYILAAFRGTPVIARRLQLRRL